MPQTNVKCTIRSSCACADWSRSLIYTSTSTFYRLCSETQDEQKRSRQIVHTKIRAFDYAKALKALFLMVRLNQEDWIHLVDFPPFFTRETIFVPSCLLSCTQKLLIITKTSQFKYTKKFTTKKWKFLDKNSDIFHISTREIDCGYSLESPRRCGSNEYPQTARRF